MAKDSQESDLEKIRQLLLTGDKDQMQLALSLAQSNAVDLSPIEDGLKEIFKVAKLQPRLGGWDQAKMENLLTPLGMVLALSIEDHWMPELPREIGLFRRVGIVELHNLYLQELPEDIAYLHNLRSLSLKYNRLKALPESIGQLQRLKSLQLQDNQLISLPDSMANLQALEVLDLAKNPNLTDLPSWIIQLPSLKRLVLDHQVFEYQIPESLKPFPVHIQIHWEAIKSKY
jgi:hypothetical protein